MTDAISKGVMRRAAAFCSSMVSTRSTRAHSGLMARPCCARMARSLSASSRRTYSMHASSAALAHQSG